MKAAKITAAQPNVFSEPSRRENWKKALFNGVHIAISLPANKPLLRTRPKTKTHATPRK
jgi:hypothetical protein